MTDIAGHYHTGTTSNAPGHTHPFPWETIESEIQELERRLAYKRAELASVLATFTESQKLSPRLQDIRRIFRRQVTRALRNASRRDPDGFSYRAKQCVIISEKGLQLPLWFDTDKGGTPNLRQKAVRQRRDGIAADVYRAICDVEHMNKTFPGDPQLNFFLDFSEDIAERRAAELLDHDKDDEEAA